MPRPRTARQSSCRSGLESLAGQQTTEEVGVLNVNPEGERGVAGELLEDSDEHAGMICADCRHAAGSVMMSW